MNEDLFNENEVVLGFVNLVGKEEDGKYRYEFIFTDNPDEFFELEGVCLSRALKSAIYHAEECVGERINHG